MSESIDDIAEYLSEGDIVIYDKVLDTGIERVYRAYYSSKIKVLNKVIADLNDIEKLKKK